MESNSRDRSASSGMGRQHVFNNVEARNTPKPRGGQSYPSIPAFGPVPYNPLSNTDHVNYEVPSANMVTNSQENRGVRHGPEPICTSDVALELLTDVTKNKQDESQKMFDRVVQLEERRDQEDPTYEPDSCEVDINEGGPHSRTRNTREYYRSLGLEDELVTLPADMGDTPSKKQKRKGDKRKAPGVVHRQYSGLGQDAQAIRDRHIKQITSNWNNPRQCWPEKLAPCNAATRQLLEPRDVSTSLLEEIERLSSVCRGDPEKGHKEINVAFWKRRRLNDEDRRGPDRLIADDIKDAIKMCSSRKTNRSDSSGGGLPSTSQGREGTGIIVMADTQDSGAPSSLPTPPQEHAKLPAAHVSAGPIVTPSLIVPANAAWCDVQYSIGRQFDTIAREGRASGKDVLITWRLA